MLAMPLSFEVLGLFGFGFFLSLQLTTECSGGWRVQKWWVFFSSGVCVSALSMNTGLALTVTAWGVKAHFCIKVCVRF